MLFGWDVSGDGLRWGLSRHILEKKCVGCGCGYGDNDYDDCHQDDNDYSGRDNCGDYNNDLNNDDDDHDDHGQHDG